MASLPLDDKRDNANTFTRTFSQNDLGTVFIGVASPAVFQLGEIQDGKVSWVGMFATDREALDTAGLRE